METVPSSLIYIMVRDNVPMSQLVFIFVRMAARRSTRKSGKKLRKRPRNAWRHWRTELLRSVSAEEATSRMEKIPMPTWTNTRSILPPRKWRLRLPLQRLSAREIPRPRSLWESASRNLPTATSRSIYPSMSMVAEPTTICVSISFQRLMQLPRSRTSRRCKRSMPSRHNVSWASPTVSQDSKTSRESKCDLWIGWKYSVMHKWSEEDNLPETGWTACWMQWENTRQTWHSQRWPRNTAMVSWCSCWTTISPTSTPIRPSPRWWTISNASKQPSTWLLRKR